MKRCFEPAVLFIGLTTLAGCVTPSPPAPSPASSGTARRLEADLRFLASDALEGRGTPSRGLDLAALYLESQLRSMGLEPALQQSYLQPYKIGEYLPGEARVIVRIAGKAIAPADYVFINIARDPARGNLDLEMVYAGYGVVSEEKGTNELKGLEVRGRAVVVSKGAAWTLEPTQVFGPDRAIGKLMAATVRGAALLVYLSSELDGPADTEAGFFREMKNAPVGFVREEGIGQACALNPILVLKPQALAAAVGSEPATLSKGPIGKKIQVDIRAAVREGRASNVLGKIPGTDPTLRGEWVVLSAHYDHLGSHSVPAGQDGIWNGADDNGSGTVGVLEVARRLAERPGKRSVLVFFTSGEDRGIFGSAYYGSHPVVPMDRVAAQVNLDMIGRSQGKVEAISSFSKELFENTVQLGKKHGLDVLPDQQPSWRLVYLTDVYHFSRFRVPGVEFFTGFHPDYHQPSDTSDKIRYAELERIVNLAADLARVYVDGAPRPVFESKPWFIVP